MEESKWTQVTNRKRALKMKQMIKAMQDNLCIVSAACKVINISRNTYYQWRKISPAFDEKIKELEEATYDQVEILIRKKIQEGDTTMTIFYAKTKMKNRGYVERIERTGADGKDHPPYMIVPESVAKDIMDGLDNSRSEDSEVKE